MSEAIRTWCSARLVQCINVIAPVLEPASLAAQYRLIDHSFSFTSPGYSSSQDAVLLRAMTAHLANAAFCICAAQIARELGLSRSAVSRAISNIEDLREDVKMDAFLDAAAALVKAREALGGGEDVLILRPYARPRPRQGVAA